MIKAMGVAYGTVQSGIRCVERRHDGRWYPPHPAQWVS
jgi:hypothetical protein